MRVSLSAVSPTNPLIQSLVSAIQTQEGPVQNNNPGNLLYAGQPGAIGRDYRGFAIFDTLASGQQAEANQIALNVNRGTCATGTSVQTLSDLIGCLTPDAPSTYVPGVSAATGIDPNADLSQILSGSGALADPSTVSADAQGQQTDFTSSLSTSDILILLALGAGAVWLFS